MKMKKYIVAAIGCLFVLPVAAQDLNPTVEVTNAFDSKLLEIHKPAREMEIPDSLTRFNLRFDYSVFDNPYRGVYEFKPYLVDMTPQPDAYDGRTFYLRMGAGYALHPTFDLLYTPFHAGRFTLNVYARHQSYIGSYRRLFAARKDTDPKSQIFLASNHEIPDGTTEADWTGYDMLSRVGANGRLEWDGGQFTFDAAYLGIHTAQEPAVAKTGLYEKSNYNAADLKLGVSSKDLGGSYMYYDANLAYRYAGDDINYDGKGYSSLQLHDIAAWGTFGPVISGSNRLLVDADFGLSVYRQLISSSIGRFSFTPKYVLDIDRLHMSLGAKISMSFSDDNTFDGYRLKPDKGQLVYPDVHVDFAVVPEYVDIYAEVVGGDTLYDYSSLKENQHFFHPRMGRGIGTFCNVAAERFNARLGVRGNIAGKFRYDLRGGFKMVKNGLLESVYYGYLGTGSVPRELMQGVSYRNYSMGYADLKCVWDAKPFLVEGLFSYKWTNLYANLADGFEPAPFTMLLRGTYNWNDRIIGGIYADAAVARRGWVYPVLPTLGTAGTSVKVPGWVDLGISGEYVLTRRLSLWVETGNLLNMTIQRVPMIPSSGITFTAGLTLRF